MKVLMDTSALVAAMVEAHPEHQRGLLWVQRAKRGEITAIVASHTLAELYSVLTSMPVQPPISPSTAWRLIQENVLNTFEVVDLPTDDYQAVLIRLAQLGIIGGAIYDALIAYAASKAEVEQIVTFNEKHFRQVYPALCERIVAP